VGREDACLFAYVHSVLLQVELVETAINKELKSRVSEYDPEEFMKMVSERPNEITGDVFDMLLSFSDFTEFKDLMHAHAKAKSGGFGFSFGSTTNNNTNNSTSTATAMEED
jgi:hypothetical protein